MKISHYTVLCLQQWWFGPYHLPVVILIFPELPFPPGPEEGVRLQQDEHVHGIG